MEQLPVLFELATAYHSCRDTNALLEAFAARVGSRVGARGALVWLLSESGEELICRAGWFEAGERFAPVPEPITEGLLAEMLTETRARRLPAKEVAPELLTHLGENDRERVRTALYAPIPAAEGAQGVLECLNKAGGEFTAADAAFAEEACRLTGSALATLRGVDRDRSEQLSTIERLTALYDISRIFNSTLELEDLLPVVAEKIRDITGAQACTLWLVDSDANELYVGQQAGEDPTVSEDTRVALGEGLLGEVAQKGEGRVVENAAEEELLAARRQAGKEFELETWLAAPLLKDETVLGVVEVVNKLDATPFDEDDLFFLSSICEQAAIALNNANLLEAERKVHQLDALLTISKEITSTLNLDHILTTVVHQAATVLPFDRCVIGLFDRNRFVLGAVSGETEVPKTREMDRLRDILEPVANQSDPAKADQYEDGWEVAPAMARETLIGYLEEQGYHGFYALPLRDDQGTVGVLALLSGDAEFLTESHLEILSILASQTTVAIRNARLYQEVPLMSVWQPLVEKRQKLLAIPYGRWVELGWKVGLAVALLVLVPWPLRIGTNATVVPAERRVVTAEVEGVIQRVEVREGDAVTARQTLALLDDSDARVRLEQARANSALAQRQLAEAEARRELAAAAQASFRKQMHEAEVSYYWEQVEKARLRAPLAGVVVTAKVEEKVGQRLAAGETFCELVRYDELAVEMNVPETQVDLIRAGNRVAVKLNTFPTQTIAARVESISAQTIVAEGEQFFVVRAVFENPEDRARPGMVGRAKISAAGGWPIGGLYPVGYVILRSPARWAWRKVWTWLP
ncbi:MAG: efflux RND transporter periplasmic adaptor subunit [Acidobacteria bacterium]|nr:efflux RND transporter periplasmic adaptor subunit [Acidobacteriota bacterium]